jgi:hypothetical protein
MREAKAAGVSKKRTAPPPSKQVIAVPEVLTHSRVDRALKKAEQVEGSRRGRPKGPYEVAVTLKLSPDMAQKIDLQVHLRGLKTRSDAIRALLEEALK